MAEAIVLDEALDEGRTLSSARSNSGGSTVVPATHLQTLPPVLVAAEPTTGLALPHATWNELWRPLLRHFAAAVPDMIPVERVSYEVLPPSVRLRVEWFKLRHGGREPRSLYTVTWHLPVTAIRDRGLRAEMMRFAAAFFHYELPPGDVALLTGMLDGPGRHGTLHLIAWLRGALVELAGSRAAAIAAPTGSAGFSDDGSHPEGDNSFAPHSDMWIPALLFNVFNHTVEHAGHSTLLPMTRLWDIARGSGMPADVAEQLRAAVVEAGECDYFSHHNGLMYDDHPWSKTLREELFAASVKVGMKPGEGYLLNDRAWLHGRTALRPSALAPEHREHRLYRLAYNNWRLEAEATERRVQWSMSGRRAAGCKA